METEIVQPAGGKAETFRLILVVATVVLVCAGLIARNRRADESRVLSEFQIGAFEELNGVEQGNYNDLRTASLDIAMIRKEHPNRAWPSVEKLADEFIPPFVRDAAWESRGKLEWSHNVIAEDSANESICLYLGKSSVPDLSGSFLLIMDDHVIMDGHEDDAHIWYRAGADTGMPSGPATEDLIRGGWLEIVPYLGEEELLRLKGGMDK